MDQAEFDIRGIIGLIRRQIGLIVSTIVIVAGLAALYLFMQTPIFTASTMVLVDPRQKNALDPQSQVSLLPTDNARVESEAEILKAPSTLLDVVKKMDLVTDPEFGVKLSTTDKLLTFFKLKSEKDIIANPERQVQQVLNNFTNRVSISRKGLTYLIGISVDSADPKKAADIANALAASYIQNQVDAKISNALTVRDALSRRLAQASSDINATENKIDAFVNENLDKVASDSTRSDISQMRSQLDQLKADSLGAANVSSELTSLAARKDWASIADQLNSDAIKSLQSQAARIEAAMNGIDAGSTKAADLRKQLDSLEGQLSGQVSQEIGTLQQKIQTNQEQQDKLRSSLRQTVLSSNLSNDVMVKIYELQQESQVSKTLYQDLLQRLRGVEAQADLQLADSRVVSEALPPNSPSSPKTNLILMLALVGGLGLGVGLAFLNENFVGGFTSDQQFEAVTGVPVISSVPVLSHAGKTVSDRQHVVDELVDHPLTAYSESIRRIRLGLENMLRRKFQGQEVKGGQVIMVGSAVPGEGKTTTAVALARAFALSGKHVLLIDCDLRRPAVAGALKIEAENGLGDYLALALDTQSIRQFVTKDSVQGLEMILGTKKHRTPTDSLIETAQFNLLMELARERFEIIILDTPPILPVVDAQYLATRADVVTLVVHWASTSQREVRSALNDLKTTVGDDLLIAGVLSKAELGVGSYRNKYNSYYYTSPDA
ncbi:GumC family protein [Oryzibacter oryziterrae]|uniref:GumC family protein n=1 Tax=Oryzibacter oryziterrae TaxID=2766474 RepID=UPI001F18F8C8|nr:Wzz/FepE/Etk N-terminal domain-containing protein [Oryzibacter oryziterrae]